MLITRVEFGTGCSDTGYLVDDVPGMPQPFAAGDESAGYAFRIGCRAGDNQLNSPQGFTAAPSTAPSPRMATTT